jgi:hypothetical protein
LRRDEMKRSGTLFFDVIRSMGSDIQIDDNIITIRKEQGVFDIILFGGDVYFTPYRCIECDNQCTFPSRDLCIDTSETRWTNYILTWKEIKILAKIVAIYYNLLPESVKKQIRESQDCPEKMRKYERRIEEFSMDGYYSMNHWVREQIKDFAGEYHVSLRSVYGYYYKVNILRVE